MSLRDVTIAKMGNRARECGWRHTPEAHGGYWGFWKSQWVESCLGRRRLALTCSPKPGQWHCDRCHTCWGGGRWKSQNRKNVYLSPYVEEPLKSKVTKSFIPELKSRKCFSCFEIPMFYVYMLWTFYVCFAYLYMAMVHSHESPRDKHKVISSSLTYR